MNEKPERPLDERMAAIDEQRYPATGSNLLEAFGGPHATHDVTARNRPPKDGDPLRFLCSCGAVLEMPSTTGRQAALANVFYDPSLDVVSHDEAIGKALLDKAKTTEYADIAPTQPASVLSPEMKAAISSLPPGMRVTDAAPKPPEVEDAENEFDRAHEEALAKALLTDG